MKQHAFITILSLLLVTSGAVFGQCPTATSGGSSSICEQESVTVSGATASDGTILWTEDGDGSLTGAATLTPTYTSVASDAGKTITLTMTVSKEGCSDATADYTINVVAKPTATAGGSATICVLGSATVSGADATNGSISWTEDGDGTLTGASTLTPTYTSVASDAGKTVILTLTVSNGSCTSATATFSVMVVGAPTATAGGNTAICETGTATVSGASATNGTILWTTFGSGILTDQNSTTPSYAPAAGESIVTLTMTVSNPTCPSASAEFTINVNPLPSLASVSMEGPVCDGTKGTVQLTGLLSNSTFSVNYSFSNHLNQTAVVTTLAGETSKTFLTSVNLDAGDDNGDDLIINSLTITSSTPTCTKNFGSPTYETTLQVDEIPTLGTIDLDSPVCEGSTATVTLNGMLAGTPSTIRYTIDGTVYYSDVTPNGSGYVTFETVPLQSENNGGDFYITQVKTVGGAQCYQDYTTSKYHSLTVNSLPAPVVSGPLSACAGSTGNSYTTVSSMTNYSWSITGGTITSATDIRTITVTWGTGATGILTVSSTKTGCTGTSPDHSVTLNANPGYLISGSPAACVNSTGNVYSIQTGMNSYSWSVSAGGTITSATDGSSVTVTWNTAGPKTVSVSYTTPTGCSATQTHDVTVNTLPVPGITSTVSIPRISDAVTYTTGGNSAWSWQVSGGGTGASSTNTINVVWNSTGAQTVTVNYADANNCTASSPTNLNVEVKPLPSVSGLTISYAYPSVGTSMEAIYNYHDGISAATECTGCTYQWYRNSVAIDGATAKTYIPVVDDANKTLTVRVTPVSSVGGALPSYTGTPVTSDPTEVIEDLSAGIPVASQVCIEGIRQEGDVLIGKYIYTYARAEGISKFKWVRTDNSEAIPEITVVGTAIEYTLTAADLAEDVEISFSVLPVSSNKTPVEGTWASSADLARIIGLKTDYSITDPDVTLVPNVPGGSFSGSGVSGNIATGYVFSPSGAGAGLHPVNYILFYDYSTDHSCSQRAPYQVNVDPDIPVFSAVDSRYCSDAGSFTVTVTNIKTGSWNNDFQLYGPTGAIYPDAMTLQYFYPDNMDPGRIDYITINPAVLTPGNHTLVYKYMITRTLLMPLPLGGFRTLIYNLTYLRDVDFYIDKVSPEMKILGLEDAYCINAGQKYISVEGVYPLGGTGTWTGDIIKPTPDDLSAYIDPALGDPGVKYVLTYQYMSPRLCPGPVITREIAVKPLPDPAFAIDPSFNVKGDPEKMLPVTPGGVFKGKGVSGDLFIPSVAEVGDHTITYVARANSCVDSAKITTRVRAALGSFSGITDTVCYSKASLNISMVGLPLDGPDGVVSYNGFSNSRKTLTQVPGSKTAVYSIVDAGEGYDTLTYSYVWDGVDYDVKKIINIDSVGTAIIYNLQQNQMICDDVAPFELTLSKPGGVFDAHSPVFGGYFDPSKATMSDTVKYTFTSRSGCSVDTVIYVNVYKSPEVDFIPYDICIDDDRDTLMFMNKTTSVNPVVKWQWEFFDEGKMTTDSLEESGYLYLKGGLQQVALSAETDKGCVVRKEKTFNIGRRPEADFYWRKDCYYPNESLLLLDATKFSTPPKSYSWKSGNTEFGTSSNAALAKTDTGFVRIEFIVRTDYFNCHDTVVKTVYIRPTIPVPVDGYFQDFEAGKGGWIKGDTSTIWTFGLPSGQEIKSAASGQFAWYTANARDGSSSVESPCFDLSATSRPSIKLKIRRDLDKERDGAVLQYRVGEDTEWRNVGRTLEDGILWYNSTAINGKPGGSQLGWTTAGASDENYMTAIHTLDELKGRKDVRFRLAYGSSGSYSDRDGFAFDDIFIGERSRQVLVEHFTSYQDAVSTRFKPLVDTIAKHMEGDVINIQYHSDIAGIDSLFVHNPGEINARTLYYGLTKVPYTFIDGGNGENHAAIFDYRLSVIDSNVITKRTLLNSPFRLYIDPVISGRVLNIKGNITAVENIQADNLTLFLAVTEKTNSGDFEGVPASETFINVFRKFIPDAGGIILKTKWNAGESIELPEKSWIIDKALNSSDIEIIAFVQNTITQEVHQAFSVIKPDIATAVEDPLLREGKFSMYPNPASNKVTIEFPDLLRSEVDIRIYNIQGEIIREYKAGAGLSEFTIEDPGLKGGIYLVRVSRGILDLGYRKLIITED